MSWSANVVGAMSTRGPAIASFQKSQMLFGIGTGRKEGVRGSSRWGRLKKRVTLRQLEICDIKIQEKAKEGLRYGGVCDWHHGWGKRTEIYNEGRNCPLKLKKTASSKEQKGPHRRKGEKTINAINENAKRGRRSWRGKELIIVGCAECKSLSNPPQHNPTTAKQKKKNKKKTHTKHNLQPHPKQQQPKKPPKKKPINKATKKDKKTRSNKPPPQKNQTPNNTQLNTQKKKKLQTRSVIPESGNLTCGSSGDEAGGDCSF